MFCGNWLYAPNTAHICQVEFTESIPLTFKSNNTEMLLLYSCLYLV